MEQRPNSKTLNPATSSSMQPSDPSDISISLRNLSLRDHKSPLVANNSSSFPSTNTIGAQELSNGGNLWPAFNPQPGVDHSPVSTRYQELDNGCAFISYAITEAGSKRLQEYLKIKNPEITSFIFTMAINTWDGIPSVFHLMTTQHGWYVFANLLDSCNAHQLELLVYKLTKNQPLFISAALTKFGSTSVMKLIKQLKKSPLAANVVANLANQFYHVMTNRLGLLVISECLDQLDIHRIEVLYEAGIRHCLDLAVDVQGCISLNKFIEKIRGRHRQVLLNKLSDNAVYLSNDPLGNHVMQNVIELQNPICTGKITKALKGQYGKLSMQKAGSHLVEKCLESSGMNCVVEDFLSMESKGLVEIARDRYGNYVIQKALKVTKVAGSPLNAGLLKCLESEVNTSLQIGFGRSVANLILNGVPLE